MSAVEVQETRVFASGVGAEWWLQFRERFDRIGRTKTTFASLGGEVVTVACDSKEDAQWLLQHMVDSGLPKSALKVIRESAK